MKHTDIIPDLQSLRWSELSLADHAYNHLLAEWVIDTGWRFLKDNPLIVFEYCEAFVQRIHTLLQNDYSFGGWWEDRSILWKGSYLDKTENYIHLWIDINTPAPMTVVSPFHWKVILSDDDAPLHHGWWNFYILESDIPNKNYLLLAHLWDTRTKKVWDKVTKWEIIWNIWKKEHNGGWFEHLHVQAIQKTLIDTLLQTGKIDDLDGYGNIHDTTLAKIYPNPFTTF
jgi:hypothetical protein